MARFFNKKTKTKTKTKSKELKRWIKSKKKLLGSKNINQNKENISYFREQEAISTSSGLLVDIVTGRTKLTDKYTLPLPDILCAIISFIRSKSKFSNRRRKLCINYSFV